MNRIKFFVSICLLVFISNLYGQEVNDLSKKMNFDEAQDLAKSENKILLLDFYTTWCPPCKGMDKNVLSKPDVAQKVNESVLFYKLNAEEGKGKELATQFNVKSYPTFLFVNSDLTPLHRFVGSAEPELFKAIIELGIQPERGLYHLESAYESGKLPESDLPHYLRAKMDVKSLDYPLFETYINKLSEGEMKEAINTDLIVNGAIWSNDTYIDTETPGFHFLMENMDDLEKQFGENQIRIRLLMIAQRHALEAIDDKDSIEFFSHLKLIKSIENAGLLECKILRGNLKGGHNSDYNSNRLLLNYYDKTENQAAYLREEQTYYNLVKDKPEALMSLVGSYSRQIENISRLEKAEKWINEVIAMKPDWYAYYGYTNILITLEKYEQAQSVLNDYLIPLSQSEQDEAQQTGMIRRNDSIEEKLKTMVED